MKIKKIETSDTPRLLELLRLNTPEYFSESEEADLLYYLENEIEHFCAVMIRNG